MTLRWRYLLAIVPLFTGLGIANAVVRYWLERNEVVWGLGERAKGAALTFAAFADPTTAAAKDPSPELRAAFERFARHLEGVSATWFTAAAGGWQATTLTESPGLRPPATPDDVVLAALRRHESVARLIARPEAPHDEAVGYAGVWTPEGGLVGVVSASVPEATFRARQPAWFRQGAGLVALLTLLGWGLAEALTQLARREFDRLQAAGDALSRGHYAVAWTPGRIGELNDLGGTFHTVASLLRDRVQRTRRNLLQVDPFPRDLELATLWHDTCDAAPDVVTPHGTVLLRPVGARLPDDFFGRREAPNHWIAVAGRLAPAPGATALARILNSTTARDYFLGLAAGATTRREPPVEPFLFPVQHLDLLVLPKDGRPPAWFRATGRGTDLAPEPAPAAQNVAGTLPADARQLAADFLRPFPPAELPLRVGELGGVLAGRGDGVLLVWAFADRPSSPS